MPAKVQRTASRSSSLLLPSKLLAAATQHAGVVIRHDASDSIMPKLSLHRIPTRACHCSGCRSGRELVGNKTCTPHPLNSRAGVSGPVPAMRAQLSITSP